MRIVYAVVLVSAVLLLFALSLIFSETWGRDLDGRYANSPYRAWYEAQDVPGQPGQRCCTQADGTDAEEDIRDGHYWVRFKPAGWPLTDWQQVPDEVVITEPNLKGVAVVWYHTDVLKSGPRFLIRCYAPAVKV